MRCYLEAEERCRECGGLGWREHPAWIEFYKDERYRDHFDMPPWSEIEAWFTAHGYDEVPDEHIPCSECDGEGYTHRRVLLREALDKLGVKMPYKNWDM